MSAVRAFFSRPLGVTLLTVPFIGLFINAVGRNEMNVTSTYDKRARLFSRGLGAEIVREDLQGSPFRFLVKKKQELTGH